MYMRTICLYWPDPQLWKELTKKYFFVSYYSSFPCFYLTFRMLIGLWLIFKTLSFICSCYSSSPPPWPLTLLGRLCVLIFFYLLETSKKILRDSAQNTKFYHNLQGTKKIRNKNHPLNFIYHMSYYIYLEKPQPNKRKYYQA